MRLAGDAGLMGTFFERLFSQIHTSRSGFLKGSGRSRTPLMTLKIAVFAPMPSASVSTATAVKPGFFSSWRKANLRSFITQSLYRINFRRAAGGQIAGQECDHDERQPNSDERYRIVGLDLIQLIGSRRVLAHAPANPSTSPAKARPPP